MKTNPLTQPKVALIDDEDHPALPQPKWMVAVASGRDYAKRHDSGVTRICMHHENLTGGRTPFPNGADRDSRLIPLTREHSRLLMLLMVNVISQRCYVTLTRGRNISRDIYDTKEAALEYGRPLRNYSATWRH